MEKNSIAEIDAMHYFFNNTKLCFQSNKLKCSNKYTTELHLENNTDLHSRKTTDDSMGYQYSSMVQGAVCYWHIHESR